MSTPTIITKITMKSIGAQPKPKSIKEGESIKLANVYGRVRGMETGSTQYGDYTLFRGTFEAINLKTGEVYAAGKMILPAVLESLITGNFTDEAMDFAFTITAMYSEKGNTGYTFGASPLIEPAAADELEYLRKAALPALPAPSKKTSKGE
jgi:hypothetical protein